MRRFFVSMAMVLTLVLGSSGLASAASANISPHTQTHAHGVASHWTLTWGNYAPYFVVFYYGDGESWTYSGSSTSASKSHTFYPCTQHTFQQELQVEDAHNAVANDYSYATEYGGNPC